MEIILISDCKLKIMLCQEDLSRFEINANQLDYSNTETKRMFWDVLSQAKRQTGFDTDGKRVLVQLYPSKAGGCEMFVTKMDLAQTTEKSKIKTRERYFIKSQNTKKCSDNAETCIFGFDSSEDMISVCKRLDTIGYIGECSAYFASNGKRYLLFSDLEQSIFTQPNELSFICEYGNLEVAQTLRCYISEHGIQVCENNAIPLLAGL